MYKGLCFLSVTFSPVIGCILFVHEWTVCIYSTGVACFIVHVPVAALIVMMFMYNLK